MLKQALLKQFCIFWIWDIMHHLLVISGNNMWEDFWITFAISTLAFLHLQKLLSLLTFAESPLLHSTPSLLHPRLLKTNLVTLNFILASCKINISKWHSLFHFSIGNFLSNCSFKFGKKDKTIGSWRSHDGETFTRSAKQIISYNLHFFRWTHLWI